MKPGVLVTILVLIIVIVAGIMSLPKSVEEPTLEEVRARIEESEPAWANYLEDLKGQIGSAPVAKWRGEITSARASEGQVKVNFEIREYWLENAMAIPMLIRDNVGYVTRESSAEFEDSITSYTFEVRQQSAPPWIEIQYPGSTRRLLFGTDGEWVGHEAE